MDQYSLESASVHILPDRRNTRPYSYNTVVGKKCVKSSVRREAVGILSAAH